MRILTALSLLSATLLFTGCASKSDYKLFQTEKEVTTEQSSKYSARSIEYHILPQDRLDVILYKDPNQEAMVAQSELGQSVNKTGILVNKAGFISLPLIGKVKVAGLTQTAAADKITRHYKKYINTPSVYLEVLNKRLYVLGEVKNPGVVKIDKEKMTLFEALAFAGDLTDAAIRDDIVILSAAKNGKMNMRHVDLTQFANMDYSQLMLRPNDIVYIQPNGWKEFKVAADDVTSPFVAISKIASPFVTLKYLGD
ncbi:MAG: Capsular polysaccharide biosynthesis/export periplasmic protein WcbA; Capsular polysaccharide export system protein KpsC [uncultured Sulfurovum sp.]|uniref:Capsular polysaccharide biosynthesis/export periplasmic protein WcbA Capsular polysaccharide export system protein KpsC n=1 Tax=uncultured Sulfurovum sp. TaxID=269237 RepID=A0A6S6U9D0_9BACT|nr:MAG: Capsular polysaccharide biosynthesis/export periplasmic protein WcbA; Capsular polysaccharide export system protein KpsC [uncultured Sulfurovum sp.]